MLSVCLRHWCLLLIALLMSASGLHLPALTSARQLPNIEQPVEVVKRSNKLFGSFYRLMQKHSRYMDEQAFVERMFRLFDMNSDNLIERDEFRAILQLLGLISHKH